MEESEVALPLIRAMHAELPRGGLSLSEMARLANLSPFHFIRRFREDTGLPPGAFQAALRMAEAKRRLRETDNSVTDICFDLGYASLGTFVRRFTTDVGVSPSRYRRLCRDQRAVGPGATAPAGGAGVYGRVVPGEPGAVPVVVSLFPRLLPRGMPIATTVVRGGGAFSLGPVADGTYLLLAAACPPEALAADRPPWVATAGPVRVVAGGAPALTVTMRRPAPTDPPLLPALSLLMRNRGEERGQRPALPSEGCEVGPDVSDRRPAARGRHPL